MSSVAIMRALLEASAPLTALVPAARIYTGQIPIGTALPAIGLMEISGSPVMQSTSRRSTTETMRSRVQVTVASLDYRQMKQALLLVKKAVPGVSTGVVKGYQVNSVIPDNINPEIPPGEDRIYEQSRDFIVTFAESI